MGMRTLSDGKCQIVASSETEITRLSLGILPTRFFRAFSIKIGLFSSHLLPSGLANTPNTAPSSLKRLAWLTASLAVTLKPICPIFSSIPRALGSVLRFSWYPFCVLVLPVTRPLSRAARPELCQLPGDSAITKDSHITSPTSALDITERYELMGSVSRKSAQVLRG